MPSSSKKTSLTLIICLAIIFYSTSLLAETVDDKIYFNYLSTGNKADKDIRSIKQTKLFQIGVGAPPLKLSTSTLLIPSVYYSRSEVLFPADPALKLTSFEPSLVLIQNFGKYFSVIIGESGLIRSESSNSFFNSKSISNSGIYLVSFQPRGDERFRISLGANITFQRGKKVVTPIGGLLFESASKTFYSEIGYPYTTIFVRTSGGAELGMALQVAQGIFYLDPTSSFAKVHKDAEYIQLMNLYLGPSVSIPFGGMTYLNIKAGANMIRQSQLLNSELDELPGGTKKFTASWFFKVGLSFRFPESTRQPVKAPVAQ